MATATSGLSRVPQPAQWLVKYCSKSTRPFVRDLRRMLGVFAELESALPRTYRWRLQSSDDFAAAIAEESPPAAVRRYWADQARMAEAYTILTAWRAADLVIPAMNALNSRELLSAAILSRSLLELAVSFIRNANTISAAVRAVLRNRTDFMIVQDFERDVVRMIWGTRLADAPAHLSQINIQTHLKSVASRPGAEELLPVYDYLCEAAHPNVVGNALYWSHAERSATADPPVRMLERRAALRQERSELLDCTLWALAWSSVVVHNSFGIIMGAIEELANALREDWH